MKAPDNCYTVIKCIPLEKKTSKDKCCETVKYRPCNIWLIQDSRKGCKHKYVPIHTGTATR